VVPIRTRRLGVVAVVDLKAEIEVADDLPANGKIQDGTKPMRVVERSMKKCEAPPPTISRRS
jgi:hypothetical protein